MRLLSEVWERIQSVVFRTREEAEMDEEIRFHLERDTAENIAAGMDPGEARRQAHLRFGGVERFKEKVREARGVRPLEEVVADVRYAVRSLRRAPTFTATAVLTLAICIGANVAIYSVVESVVLSPLPYDQPDRLVTLYNSYPGAGVARGSNSVVDFFLRKERIDALVGVALYGQSANAVGEAGSPEMVTTLWVTPSFFPLLGVEAAVGRTFVDRETGVEREREVLLTHAYWSGRFDGATNLIGTTLRVEGEPFTIVGVLPEDFRVAAHPDVRLVLPISTTPEQRSMERWHNNNWEMMGRLAPGATVEQASTEIAAMNAAAADEWPNPNGREFLENTGFHTVVVSAKDDLVRDVRSVLYLLWAGVALVLLLGCVNTANLMLARSHARLGELATRLALGARRVRLSRQILTEAFVIALLGAATGFGVGALGLRVLDLVGIEELPRAAEVALRTPVFVFTLLLAVGASILLGAIPIAYVLRNDLNVASRVEGRGGTAVRRAVLVRSGLVTCQVAAAFLLLVSTGLMLRSFQAATQVDPGFRPEGIFTASVSLSATRYPISEPTRQQFTDELLKRVRALPSVTAASVTSLLPFSGRTSSIDIRPDGHEPGPGESVVSPFHNRVGPQYFQAMAIEVLAGRTFEQRDGPDEPNVIVLDERLARHYWPDRSPLGARMVWGVGAGGEVKEENLYTVIGVVESVKQNDLTAPESDYVGAYYFTYRQRPFSFLTLVARTGSEPESLTAEVRRVVAALDPELPLFGVQTMKSRVRESLVTRRTAMLILSSFAGIALLLAVVGIYGVLAYSITQRTREIGIRIAMGGTPAGILRLVLSQGLVFTGLGVTLGAFGALGLGRLLQSLLFEVRPTEPWVLAGATAILAASAAVACIFPARRATRIDPVTALGQE